MRSIAPLLACLVIAFQGSSASAAGPLLEDGRVDTQEDSPIDIFPDVYVVSAEADLDFSSIAIVEQPLGGVAWVDEAWGVLVYEPAPGFYGYDALSYTIRDVNGEESNVGWIYLYVEPYGEWNNAAPLIANFRVSKGLDDYWVLRGTVLDENAYGLTVTFGGVLEGHSVLVNDYGDFSTSVSLPSTTSGEVTAETVDDWGVLSNLARDLIVQP